MGPGRGREGRVEVREGTRRTEKGKEEHAAKSKAEGPKPGLRMTPRKRSKAGK